jgi:MerR family transcriptional regulator/heat shock protein HspR
MGTQSTTQQELFFISVAAEMLGMHPQTLRKYERLGLVQPSRTIGSMRLYSREELERLRPLMDESALTSGAGRRQLLMEIRRLTEAVGL